MASPQFVGQVQTAWSTNALKTSPSFTTQVGDLLIVVTASQDASARMLSPPTNSGVGQTWTLQRFADDTTTASRCATYFWTAVASAAQTMTVTVAKVNQTQYEFYGFQVAQYRGHGGVGNVTLGLSTSISAPSTTLTTSAGSSIYMFNSDWEALDGTTRAYRSINSSTGTELAYFRDSSSYAVYAVTYADAGAAGVKTLGMTTPSAQTWTVAAVEITASLAAATGVADRTATAALTATGAVSGGGGATVTEDFSVGAVWDETKWAVARAAPGSWDSIVSGKGRLNTGTNTGYSGARGRKYITDYADGGIAGTVTIYTGPDGAARINARADGTFNGLTGYELLILPGNAIVRLLVVSNYVGTDLASVSGAIPAGTYNFALSAVGTTVRAKFYVVGGVDPGWHMSATDVVVAGTGAWGVMAAGGNSAGSYMDFDDIVLTIGTGGGAFTGDGSCSATATLAAVGRVGTGSAVSLAGTVGRVATGLVARSSGASRATTATLAATSTVGGGAVGGASGILTAAGRTGAVGGAALAGAAGWYAAGMVTRASGSGLVAAAALTSIGGITGQVTVGDGNRTAVAGLAATATTAKASGAAITVLATRAAGATAVTALTGTASQAVTAALAAVGAIAVRQGTGATAVGWAGVAAGASHTGSAGLGRIVFTAGAVGS